MHEIDLELLMLSFEVDTVKKYKRENIRRKRAKNGISDVVSATNKDVENL